GSAVPCGGRVGSPVASTVVATDPHGPGGDGPVRRGNGYQVSYLTMTKGPKPARTARQRTGPDPEGRTRRSGVARGADRSPGALRLNERRSWLTLATFGRPAHDRLTARR